MGIDGGRCWNDLTPSPFPLDFEVGRLGFCRGRGAVTGWIKIGG